MSTPTDTDTHYRHHTKESYESAWFYADKTPYQYFLAEKVKLELGLRDNIVSNADFNQTCLLDAGCGTGNFTRRLVEECASINQALGIDPFLDFGEEVDECSSKEETKITPHFKKVSAEKFFEEAVLKVASPPFYNKVLFKEVIHHFESEASAEHSSLDGFARVFRNVNTYFKSGMDLHELQVDDCRACIVTREHDPSHYPFFAKAREVWRRNQRPKEEYVNALEQECWFRKGAETSKANKGSGSVTVKAYDFPVQMPLSQWKGMIRARFWSTFSEFNDAEIEAGLKEMDALKWCGFVDEEEFDKTVKAVTTEADVSIRFMDRLVFITAKWSHETVEKQAA